MTKKQIRHKNKHTVIINKLVEQYKKELLIERLKTAYREKQFQIAAQEKARVCTR